MGLSDRARSTAVNALIKAAVVGGRVYGRAVPSKQGAVTIVAVNYNAVECLDALHLALAHHGPLSIELLIVDNASTDGSAAWLRAHRDVRSLRLPVNLGHARAMDIGFALARSEIVVAFDIDAFPLSPEWYDAIVTPVVKRQCIVSGVSMRPLQALDIEPYAHPCCLAMRRDDFVRRHHSFVSNYPAWDTGQRISQLEADHLHLVPATSVRGPGAVGMVFGGVIYHNFYGTRFKGNTRERIDWVDRGDPEAAWSEAVERYIDPLRT
jgi:glycosyltransferase involved in cell wall biosynthesis